LKIPPVSALPLQSGGNITVESEPGQGATFRIYLPYVARPASAPVKPKNEDENERAAEVLLVVEDEAALLEIIQEHLDSLGYTVLTAHNGEEALNVVAGYSGTIELVITDVVMPKMGGRELVERLKQLGSSIPVIYMSGYTNNSIAREGVLGPGIEFLQKPFHVTELGRTIRRIFRAKPANEPEVFAAYPPRSLAATILPIAGRS
jgi:two-component system, cell cycle sensor histidine kinase and response regulator CckA